MRLRTHFRLIVLVAIVGASLPAAGQQASDLSARRFVYPASPDAVVVTFSERFDALEDADLGPTLLVFGDGRAEIHYPAYMARAGDWQVQLSNGELRTLVQGLVDRGVAEFDID